MGLRPPPILEHPYTSYDTPLACCHASGYHYQEEVAIAVQFQKVLPFLFHAERKLFNEKVYLLPPHLVN